MGKPKVKPQRWDKKKDITCLRTARKIYKVGRRVSFRDKEGMLLVGYVKEVEYHVKKKCPIIFVNNVKERMTVTFELVPNLSKVFVVG